MRLTRNKRELMQKIVDETDIDELLRIIGLLDDETRALVLQAISKRLTIAGKTQTLIKIKDVIAGSELLVKDWLVEAIAGSYVGGANMMYADIRKLKVSVPDGRVVQQNFTRDMIKRVDLLTVHKDAINALVSDAYLDFANGMNGLVKGAEHQLNDTLKKQIRAINISKQITGASIKTVAKEVEETIGKQGFSVLVDRGGRQWSLKRYSNMLVRTHTIKAANEGAINRAVEFGVDIVEISTHGGACDICKPYEGKKYSISGRSDDFPALTVQLPIHPNCYAKDVEVYTENGWELIKDVAVNTKALSLNPDTLDLEYVKVAKTHKRKDEKMVRFSNSRLDMLVTPDHQMFFQTDTNRKQNNEVFKFVNAEDLINAKSGRFYASSKWKGSATDVTVEFAQFMGIWLSEGSVTKQKNSYVISIAQSKEKNPEKWEQIKTMLGKFTTKHICVSDTSFRFYDKELSAYLLQFGKSYQKFVPENIKESEPHIIEHFLHFFNMGDGSRRKPNQKYGGNFRDEITYSSSSKRLIDDLGELIIKTGYRPSFRLAKTKGKRVKFKNGTYTINHDQWHVSQCYSQYYTLQNAKIEIVDYNDFSYCVELEKYHTLLVRRKGKVLWCGNCRHSILPRPFAKGSSSTLEDV